LAHLAFQTRWIARFGASFTLGALSIDLVGWPFRASGVKFFFASQTR